MLLDIPVNSTTSVQPIAFFSRVGQLNNYEFIISNDDQSWFWTDEWQEGEATVDELIQRGEYESFDSMSEFLRTLNFD